MYSAYLYEQGNQKIRWLALFKRSGAKPAMSQRYACIIPFFFFFLYYSIFEDENMEVNSPKVTEANEEVKV